MNTQNETIAKSFRILIIEDNPDVANMLNMLVSEWGQQTKVAYDPPTALVIAEKFRPHVVLLDIGLPKMHGYAVARKLRESDWGRSMLIVAVTGWGQDADRQQSRAAGINHHLLKPVDPDVLYDLLAQYSPPGE